MAALRPSRWRLVLTVAVGGLAVVVAAVGGLIVTGTWTPDVELAALDGLLDGEPPDEGEHEGAGRLAGPAYYDSVAAVCGLLDPADLELALAHPYHEGIAAPLDHAALIDIPALTRCWYPAAEPAPADGGDAQPEQPTPQSSPSPAGGELAQPDPPSTPADPGDLAEPENLPDQLGEQTPRPERPAGAGAAGPAAGGMPTVASDVVIGVVYAYADQIFADVVDTRRERSDLIEMDGLGDEAVWDPQTWDLLIHHDDKIVALSVTPAGDEPDEALRQRTRRLAEKTLERLR